jgi:hypothetical protein
MPIDSKGPTDSKGPIDPKAPAATAEGSALPLLAWLSPSFPVGAFAYSHGLEWAAEAGDIRDRETCAAWIADLLRHGAGRNDAILLAAAWRAVRGGNESALRRAAELSAALQPTPERRLEATAQGAAFQAAAAAAWPNEGAAMLRRVWPITDRRMADEVELPTKASRSPSNVAFSAMEAPAAEAPNATG